MGGDGAYMKVLVVNSKSPRHSTGGAEFSSAQIATDIARLGHDVVFASLAEAGSAPADIIQDGVRYTEVVSHAPLLDRRSLRGPARIVRRLRREWHSSLSSFGVSNGKQVRELFDRERPDLVITNMLRGWSTSVWREAARRRVPVVHVIREYDLICPRALVHDGQPCRNQQIVCRLRVAGARRMGRNVVAWGVSEAVLVEHQKRGVFSTSPVRAFYPRIDVSSSATTERDLSFGFLGRASWEKGLDILAQAAALAGITVHVGAPLTGSLLARAEHYPDSFELHGQVEAQAFLRRLGVLVVPSVWQEPLGRIVLEAAAVGTPVIISDVPGLIEAAKASGAAWMSFRQGDSADLARVLDDARRGAARWRTSSAPHPPGDAQLLITDARERVPNPPTRSRGSIDSGVGT